MNLVLKCSILYRRDSQGLLPSTIMLYGLLSFFLCRSFEAFFFDDSQRQLLVFSKHSKARGISKTYPQKAGINRPYQLPQNSPT